MSEATNEPKVPPLYLPPESTRHLRALIYASTPGRIITNLSLHSSSTQIVISLSQTSPLTPLYHSPHPNNPHNNNFLSDFPITACYTPPSQEIVFHTTLPDIVHTLSDEHPLQNGILADSPNSVLLKTGTLRVSNGLVVVESGFYHPLVEFPRGNSGDVIGAWGRDDVSITAGLLRLARFLYRRCNRRIRTNGSRAVKKEVVVLAFRENGVTIRRGWIAVSGIRRWVCALPLRGGVAHFVPVDTGRRREVLDLLTNVVEHGRGLNKAVERAESAGRSGRRFVEQRRRRKRSGTMGDVRRGDRGDTVGKEDEIMVWKMREFNFGERDAAGGDDRVERAGVDDEGESVVEVLNVDEGDDTGTSEVKVMDVDVDALGNTTTTTTTTTSSSDSEREEEMMETLCRQYLNQGYLESVEHELRR